MSKAEQLKAWKELSHSIRASVASVAESNVADMAIALLRVNVVAGRGLMASQVLARALADPSRTPALAALVAILHTKVPVIGNLVAFRALKAMRAELEGRSPGQAVQDGGRVLAAGQLLAHMFNQHLLPAEMMKSVLL